MELKLIPRILWFWSIKRTHTVWGLHKMISISFATNNFEALGATHERSWVLLSLSTKYTFKRHSPKKLLLYPLRTSRHALNCRNKFCTNRFTQTIRYNSSRNVCITYLPIRSASNQALKLKYVTAQCFNRKIKTQNAGPNLRTENCYKKASSASPWHSSGSRTYRNCYSILAWMLPCSFMTSFCRRSYCSLPSTSK